MKTEEKVPGVVYQSQAYKDGQTLGNALVSQQQRMQQVVLRNNIALQAGLFNYDYSSLRNSNNGDL